MPRLWYLGIYQILLILWSNGRYAPIPYAPEREWTTKHSLQYRHQGLMKARKIFPLIPLETCHYPLNTSEILSRCEMNSPHLSVFNRFPFSDVHCRRMYFEVPDSVKPEAMALELKMSRESDRNISTRLTRRFKYFCSNNSDKCSIIINYSISN